MASQWKDELPDEFDYRGVPRIRAGKTEDEVWFVRMAWEGGNALTVKCDALFLLGDKIKEMASVGKEMGFTKIKSITIR